MPNLPELIRLDLTPDEFSLLTRLCGGAGMLVAAIELGDERYLARAVKDLMATGKLIDAKMSMMRAQASLLRKLAVLAAEDEASRKLVLGVIDEMEERIDKMEGA